MREALPCTGRQGTPDPLRGPILVVWHLATVADVETTTNSLCPIRAERWWLIKERLYRPPLDKLVFTV
jgi:hypothetical protein